MDITWDDLSDQQKRAVEKAEKWWARGVYHRPFFLDGWAGTGKSTVTKIILDILKPESPRGIAPTNKAARVATMKSGMLFTTGHNLLYRPAADEINELRAELTEYQDDYDNPRVAEIEARIEEIRHSEVRFNKKEISDIQHDLLLIDERYMVSEAMAADLNELEIPILATGDNFQLPPVKGKSGWQDFEPDVVLTDVRRVTGDGSGILLASKAVREERDPVPGPGFEMYKRGKLNWQDYSEFDIVLCGTNNVRRMMNKGLRRLKGWDDPIPRIGDKVISLSNRESDGVCNGETFTISDIQDVYRKIIVFDIVDEYGNEIKGIRSWLPLFEDDSRTSFVPHGVAMFTFAYAATVHKFQGSEANAVCLLDDWKGSHYTRWKYTGITRARARAALVG